MGKRKNASGSVYTFLTLMRNLDIVIMNRADFCKRQIVQLEGKAFQYRSISLKLISNCSSSLSLITQKSDIVLATRGKVVSKMNTRIAGLIEEGLSQQNMKKAQKMVDNAINLVYAPPLITSSPNPSRDLCNIVFTQFQLLQRSIDWLDKFNCYMDSCQSLLMEVISKFSSLVNPLSTDHNNNGTVDS